jgi:hypothetical protein
MRACLCAAILLGAPLWPALPSYCHAQDVPEAPATRVQAEAAGLQRVNAAELARGYAGKRVLMTDKGQVIRLTLRPDGTLDYADEKGISDTGSWLVQPANGGTLCRRYSKEMGGRTCVVYFTAPDGLHWFGYGASDGRWRDTTRPLSGP